MHNLREDLGVVDASDLPIKNYENKKAADVATAIRRLHSTDEVQMVVAYEKAHKNRSTVVDSGTHRLGQLAEEFVNK